jgi:ectoine hydroxylase-related dioxygenase (phytanoyl-CoA dioxygenase family)
MLKVNSRQISLQEIKDFKRDGVICLKSAVNDNWVERMQTAVDRNLLHSKGVRGSKRKTGDVVHDYGLWLKDSDFRDLVFESPLAMFTAQIMESEKLNFLCDGFFVKKPNADSYVGWHNDQPYWPVKGWKCCKIWLALDRVTQKNARLEYIKGSHLWDRELRENSDAPWFLEPSSYEILSWDMEPGDALVHHFLTIHHSISNTSTKPRRAIVTNWTGDDVVYYNRPHTWPFQPIEEIGIPEFDSIKTLQNGEPIDCEIFPKIDLTPRTKA